MPGSVGARGPTNPQRFFSLPPSPPSSGGVAVDLASTPVGVGVASGALSVQHLLAASPVGVGVDTAALSVKHQLATSPVGVGTDTAALSVKHLLATSAVGVGVTIGALFDKESLQASPKGVGVVSAALSEKHLLGTASSGVGITTADLTVGNLNKHLAGSIVGTGVASAALSVTHLVQPGGEPFPKWLNFVHPKHRRPPRLKVVVRERELAVDNEDAIVALYAAGAIDESEFAVLLAAEFVPK